jgi:Protein of unknown function (DUF1566)
MKFTLWCGAALAMLFTCAQARAAELDPERANLPAAVVAVPSPESKLAAAAFTPQDDDHLRNTVTGLLWERSDNGSDINWDDAKDRCARSADWRLPTLAELASLYDARLPQVKCGDYMCRVPHEFRLTSAIFWTGRTDGPYEASVIWLTSDFRHANNRRASKSVRVLCVRPP